MKYFYLQVIRPADLGIYDNYIVKKQMIHSCTVIASNLVSIFSKRAKKDLIGTIIFLQLIEHFIFGKSRLAKQFY